MRKLLLWSVVSVAVAGCGGSSNAPRAASFSTAVKFSKCMRSHGVPNFPDPTSGGDLNLGGTGINPQSPSFQGAQKACAKFQPGGAGVFPKTSAAQTRQAVRFAQCMRAHGEPNFPDPALKRPSGAASVLVLRGMVFAFSSPVDPQTPAFRHATSACGIRPQ